jgi:SET domain-containing protein
MKEKEKVSEMKNVFSWMNPKLEVRETEKMGKGIFAKKKIKKDEILAIFGGYIVSAKDEEKLPAEFRDHGVQISEDFILTVKKKSEIESGGYFNHSCNPNAGYNGQIFLVSMREIKINEEITFDYGMVLHKSKNRKAYKIKCLCGSENCRGYITDYDWKLKELQKKYEGYFQWYLQKKITKK